eukprot:TRINITY_DN2126_c0_g1_i2.p1 TRINITY_DN2126_c0_g1~~TRINITY_DN2126_c0_g1_i2.p1  ORF type:complete len:457 (+),score=24.98 TRINITY_DN2126_c0_g1_i2:535-1905(+)
MRGFIGYSNDTAGPYVYTHFVFSLTRSKQQIIKAELFMRDPVSLSIRDDEEELELAWTWSVIWRDGDTLSNNHTIHTSGDDHIQSVIPVAMQNPNHVFWTLASLILGSFAASYGLLVLMRTLTADLRLCWSWDEVEQPFWTLLRWDVWRLPERFSLLCDAVGVGWQILWLATLLAAYSCCFSSTSRASMITAFVVLYTLTSGVATKISVQLFTRMARTKYPTADCSALVLLFTAPLLLVFFAVNYASSIYGSTSTVPLTAVSATIIFYLCGGLLSALLGLSLGQYCADSFYSRSQQYPRELPIASWHLQSPLARAAELIWPGVLPFCVVLVEVRYVFDGLWGDYDYTTYWLLPLALAVLVYTTTVATLIRTYFQLNREDYRWWWQSFVAGGSAAIYLFAYAVFYYVYQSSMHGMLQFVYYMGYTALICWAMFLMLGSVGFFAARQLVYCMYPPCVD